MKVLSVSSIDIWNEIVLHKRWNSQFHIWKSRWRFQGVKHKILHYSHTQIWKKIFQLKVWILCTSYMKVWTQNILQKMWIFFFILELWKSGCRFFDRKYKNVYFTYPNIVTWNMEFFSYFPFENICEFFPSWNIEYCLFNIWKACFNFPTRYIELSHRFSCLNSETLYIFIKNVWKVFCYEVWNSVYFPFDNLGRNVLIWNMNFQFSTCETFSIFVHMKENFPWFRY